MERIKEFLRYEPETGKFFWKETPLRAKRWNTLHAGKEAGRINSKGYIEIGFERQHIKAHRLAWYFLKGVFPEGDIDHINNLKWDNRECNLREATRSQNLANRKALVTSKSGLKGVYFHKGKWTARVSINNKSTYLGRFSTMEEAKQAYDEKAYELFGDFHQP